MRHFVIIGQTASASGEFSLDDLPSSSGRLDVLLRCIRAALLLSHGLRQDVRVYLVLRGGPRAPRVLRVDGASVKYLRPDERSLATLVKKALTAPDPDEKGFVEVRPGLALARGDVGRVIEDLGGAAVCVLEQGAPALAASVSATGNTAFFVGDHLGIDEATRRILATLGATPASIGPLSLHAEDAIAIASNLLDQSSAHRAPPE